MTEWEIIVDSDNLPEPEPEKPPRSRRYQRWYLLIAVLLALFTIGAVTFMRERTERQAALEADLTDFIYEEETVRFFGQPDRAAEYMVSTAPPEWQQRYRQAFAADENQSPPTSVQLRAVDFDGQCALVSVELDGYTQTRVYCLENQQWRRAPVPGDIWGDGQSVLNLPHGGRLIFRPRDQAFATALAGDLPPLLDELEQWRAQSAQLNPTQPKILHNIDIVIEPHDLGEPLIFNDEQRIVLNSPLLVSPAEDELPSGQAGVRVAVAESLLRQAGFTSPETSLSLPGADRFLEAVQTVIATELMLATQVREELLSRRQSQVNENWTTPFFTDLLPTETEPTDRQAHAAAYLTAEYIQRLKGSDTLVKLLQELPSASSWDSLFEATLGRSTISLEQEVVTYAKTGDVAAAASLPPADYGTSGRLPLQGTLLGIREQSSGGVRLAVKPAYGGDDPVLVETSREDTFETANGGYLPVECVPPGATVSIDGGWLEIQRRLQASEVRVEEVRLLDINPAPLDTVAYLIEGESPDGAEFTAADIFPSQRFYFVASKLPLPQALVALRQDGRRQLLTSLNRNLRVVPLPVAAGDSAHFLFVLDLPGCNHSWFIHYEPGPGITGQWLGPAQPMKWIWRADRNDLIFFDFKAGEVGHNIYKTGDSLAVEPIGQSETLVSVSGWNAKAEQIVFVKRDWVGATGIGLLEPDSGAIRRAKIYVYPVRARRLSPDGNWLAYLTGVRNRLDPPYRLELLNLETLEESTLVQVEGNEAIGPAIWSPYLDDPRVAVLSGPIAANEILHPTGLLIASPDQPGSSRLIVEAEASERLATPVFCADGGLLYRVDREDEYSLMYLHPDQGARLLLTSNRPFQPVACP